MARLNRPTVPFIGLLVSLGTTSGIGCGFDTHGSPIDTTSTGTTGGAGGMGGDGGMAGMGGMAGAGGGMVCKPGTKEPCYSGPPNTPNIGTCKAGTKTCLADGTGYDVCVGEVVPVLENCVAMGDEDCDSFTDLEDSECKCTVPNMKTPCDTGLLGICRMGVGVCSADGRSVDMCAQSNMPTPENCATPEDDDCDGTMAAMCTGDPQSTYAPPGSSAGTKDDAIFAVALTPNGGSVIAGVIDGTIGADGFGIMAGTAYIAKLDVNHALVWEKKYTATTWGVVRGIAVDAMGNIVAAGSFSGTMNLGGAGPLMSNGTDGFIVKLKSDGGYLGSQHITSSKTQSVNSVAVDAAGNINITGSTDDPINLGGSTFTPNGIDFFVASYAPNLTHRWSKLYPSAGSQFGRSIAVTSNNDVVVTGDTADITDLGGGTIMKDKSLDIFVARYASTDGAFVWGKLYGKMMDQFGRSVAMAPDGNVLITGGFEGTINWNAMTSMTAVGMSDVFVAKLDVATGDYLKHAQGGKTGTSVGSSVAADASGNVTVFGYFNGSIDFGGQSATSAMMTNDTFLVKLKSSDWSPVWTKPFGKAGNQYGWDVAVANDGSDVVGGGFYTELDVPPNATILSSGGSDIFAVFTNP